MSSNKLSYLLESANFDWRSTYIDLDGGACPSFSYPLTPSDYLDFAKSDFDASGTHGHVNAVANAKRAIDCQVDTIVSTLGYTPANLRKQLGQSLVAKIETESSQNALPFAFKFLESIGASTPSIVDRARLFRHSIEHRYQKPTRKRAIEALEIATLFVRATESLLFKFDSDFGFGCEPINFRGTGEFAKTFNVSIHCEGNPHAVVVYWKKPFATGDASKSPRVTILPEHESYYWLLRIALAIGREVSASRIQPLLRGFVTSSKANITPNSIRIAGFN